ncbi:MAG: asparagine synthetase B, partial [Aliifodinibius sp.]|nr:asparagine synthetase B [candidate division Zixibacteria bacterium]NIT59682.1 asparagine synthetase B [Fodinibius sp.]NIS47637.1 asparagine synthetase B [candidate division Zixibacteria bacterium]NIU15729.1 asparagine synthetase B [candidate division Zixibacteria bacterium]NIV08461.1 asparagine synthetase B [candidate division Zixibacteria bacterium]
ALSDYIWHAEKPVLRKAPIPLYLLSEFVRQNDRKVVLTGEGADEVFGGYNIFREAKVRRFWAKQPDSQFRPLLLKKLYPYIFKNTSSHRMLALFFGRGLTDVENPLYSHQLRWSNSGRNKSYFSDKLKDAIGEYDPMEELQKHLPAGFHQWDYFEKA